MNKLFQKLGLVYDSFKKFDPEFGHIVELYSPELVVRYYRYKEEAWHRILMEGRITNTRAAETKACNYAEYMMERMMDPNQRPMSWDEL